MIKGIRLSGLLMGSFFLVSFLLPSAAQVKFEQYFTRGCIRIDLVLAGNNELSEIYLDEIRKEPFWGGPHNNPIDPFDYGEYRILVMDDSTGELIFSKGFCTYFEEWQTVAEAKTRNRAFDQVIRFPTPLAAVSIEIQQRDDRNVFQTKFSTRIDPDDPYLIEGLNTEFPYRKILDNGLPAENVDLVFIAEGYTAEESEKFYEDVRRLSDFLLSVKPFKKFRKRFNIYAVAAVSKDSGTDLPGDGIWKSTALGSNFYTFRLERYLMTEDCKAVRDAAANVPYDQICILVNTDKYGGGGIYNHYSILGSDNIYSEIVLVHEFGHAFAGLADEYYTSDVAYDEFFKLELEPWQPNITTLVNFESKWKDLLGKRIPVPTPATDEFAGKTGVFEGGGYSLKGIYRPAVDCRMKSNSADQFCEVCQDALRSMILYHTK